MYILTNAAAGVHILQNLSVQHKRGQGIVLSTVIPQPCPSQHINQGRSAQDDHRAAGLLPAGQVHAHAGGLLHLGGTGTQRQAVQGPKAAEKTRETRVYFGYLYFNPTYEYIYKTRYDTRNFLVLINKIITGTILNKISAL